MFICHCNALTATNIKDAISDGAERPCAVYSANGCKAICGGCTPTILNMLRESKDLMKNNS